MNTQTLTKEGLANSAAAVANMENAMSGFQRTTLSDLLTQQATLVDQTKEAASIDDATLRAARQEIIAADMKSLEAKIAEYREDTAELIAGLEAQFQKLGLDLSGLQKATPEDLQIVKRAEDHLKSVEINGPRARSLLTDAIVDAESGWNPIGREGRVNEAKRKLAEFDGQHETDVAAANMAVEEAKAEVNRLRNKRIREAEFDSQFERFIALAQQIMTKLLDNVKQSEIRMGETKTALIDALRQKEGLAGKLAEIDGRIRAQENEVMSLETERSNAVDQNVRAPIETKLGEANLRLANLNGEKQEMQVAFNAFEAAAKKHEEILATLQVQHENQRAHARKLSIDSKARFQQAQNIVTVIRNTAQEDAASRLHTAGSTLDRTSLEIAARALIASERERINMLLNHEKDMKQFDQVGSALAEGRAQIAIEDAEIAARMQKNYGIDPLQASWLHLAQNMGEAAPAPAQ